MVTLPYALVRLRLGAALAALAVLVSAAGRPASAQTLRGQVLEEGRDVPVANAALSLLDGDGRTVARAEGDALGRFALAPPQAGEYVIEVTRIGYEPTRSPLLALSDTGSAAIDFVLRPLPIGLEGLSVTVESEAVRLLRSYGQSPRSLGRRWIDRAAIRDVETATRAKDVLRWQGVPGVYIREDAGSPGQAPLCLGVWRAKKIGSANPPCAITILNGVKVNPVEANQITPEEIEAMAVLTPTEATTIYGTEGGGGAVMIWTRRGGG